MKKLVPHIMICASAFALMLSTKSSAASYPPGRNVVIVAGHTFSSNKGAKACYYGWESVFNDTIVNYFSQDKYRLPGINYIIAPSFLDLSLEKKVQFARENDATLYIEIHHDSGAEKDVEKARKEGDNSNLWKEMSGFCILYYDDGGGHESAFPKESRKFADLLADEMIKAGFKPDTYHSKYQNMLLADPKKGIYNRIKPNTLYVLRNAKYPAVLLECGYIINPNEVKVLSEPATHVKIVNALNAAIKKYFDAK